MLEYQGKKFKEFLKFRGISPEKASTLLGLKSRQSIYSYYKSDNLTREVVNKIIKVFNTTEDEVWGNDAKLVHSLSEIEVHENKMFPTISKQAGVPYYDIDFIAGFDLILNNQTINPEFYIDFQPFNDADYWVNVSGKSMGPLIAHGDIVALKEVQGWQDFLLEGEIYAIITNNGFRTVKILSEGKDEDHYTLRSYNKSEEYSPQPIPKKIITHVFRVKGAIKKFF